VSSQGETVIAVDAAGGAGPALVWLDNRAVAEARELSERFADADVYDRTGGSVGKPDLDCLQAALVRPQRVRAVRGAHRFLLVEDFILHRLSGRFVTDGGFPALSSRHP